MNITAATRIAAVLGWPIAHTRSPQLVNAAFAAAGVDAVMIPMGVPPEKLAEVVAALRAMDALGASVTIPHKLAVAALCDELSPAARDVGAVNCLQIDRGRVVGHNTDAPGFLDGLAAAGFEARGKRVVLLGAGGAARAVAYALRDLANLDVIARRANDIPWGRALPWTAPSLRDAFAAADLVVDCTPVGLAGDDEQRAMVDALPLDALRPQAHVASLIYHHATILLERAKQRGHSTVDGRAMLVGQGARAFTIWTGRSAPVAAMTRALDDALHAGT
jgi:shikimate dehydrogenase